MSNFRVGARKCKEKMQKKNAKPKKSPKKTHGGC
tara:strand:- start:345 stop:446 length:102 start_codon:yes stop_codon:yes gene_type:complete